MAQTQNIPISQKILSGSATPEELGESPAPLTKVKESQGVSLRGKAASKVFVEAEQRERRNGLGDVCQSRLKKMSTTWRLEVRPEGNRTRLLSLTPMSFGADLCPIIFQTLHRAWLYIRSLINVESLTGPLYR